MQISNLESTDIPRAQELVAAAGWNQTADTWSRFINFHPTGCFKAVIDQRLVGTVTSTCYGRKLAWIGMMLVHPDTRRQGVGRKLMEHIVQHLRHLCIETIKLDATPMGKPLYESLGFIAQYEFFRWHRAAIQSTPQPLPAMSFDQLTPGLVKLDQLAFGVERIQWLRQTALEGHMLITDSAFGMLRPGRINEYLGPVTAQSFAAAKQLIEVLCHATNAAILWDIPKDDRHAHGLADELGFTKQRPLIRMVLGEDHTRPDLDLQWAICDPASG